MGQEVRPGHDRFGNPLVPGDRAELFPVVNGDTGGEALGWKGGIPGVVREISNSGCLLIEHDQRTQYAPPYDVVAEWQWPNTVVKH
jgi:hypothetical protein